MNMKTVLITTLILMFGIYSMSAYGLDEMFNHEYSSYNSFLKENVADGKVNYQNIKKNIGTLDEFLTKTKLIAKKEYISWSENQKLAFLINVYNAATLKLVAENYPLKSIKDIEKPWDKNFIDLLGNKISLNHLEHEIIRKEFNEPRIHFALVCAAKGCPILISEAYTSDKLDSQLENSTKNFLKTKDKNRVDVVNKTIYLSPIFDWFKDDFTKKSGLVASFIKPYFKQNSNLESYQIKYTNYDWTLNDNV